MAVSANTDCEMGHQSYWECDSENELAMNCIVCNCALGVPGGYGGSGMCGPCCTGEAGTSGEFGESW